MNALEKGAKVMYLTLDDFLLESKLKNNCWNNVLNSDLIVVDDMFYLTPTEYELVLIYKLMMFPHETRCIIIVANRPLPSLKYMNVDTYLIEILEKDLCKMLK